MKSQLTVIIIALAVLLFAFAVFGMYKFKGNKGKKDNNNEYSNKSDSEIKTMLRERGIKAKGGGTRITRKTKKRLKNKK